MSVRPNQATAEGPPTISRDRLGLRFALTFAAITFVLFSFYCYPYADDGAIARGFTHYLSGYAHAAGVVLSLFDPSVQVTGTQIIGRYGLEIVKNCDAIEVNILFASAVLALPFPIRSRLLALLMGLALLVLANVFRICSLYFVGIFRPSAFEFWHLELWPLLLIGFTAANFLLWANWMLRQQAKGKRVSG